MFVILLSLSLSACSDEDREIARLASGCIKSSPDNRVKLSGSMSNNFEVERHGDEILVRTEVPVGIGLDGKVKFRHREFRCVETNGEIRYVSAVWE
ncbi:MAG: hypothetical protein R3174_15675 [Gammaproteobacteria bacterium]|nr:hypothetical protein [Gammaproteobacteria bacterium]